jgi:hypothetical protein
MKKMSRPKTQKPLNHIDKVVLISLLFSLVAFAESYGDRSRTEQSFIELVS